jgi:hypothetical protein
LTSGKVVILVIGVGVAVIAGFAIVLALTAGAPPVDPVDPTPQAVRKDCPSGWKPLYDASARFSLCHPADWTPRISGEELSITAPGASKAGVQILGQPGDGLEPACGGGLPVPTVKANRTTTKIAGKDRSVCITDTYAKAGDATPASSSITYRLPVTSGGVLNIVGTYSDAASRGLILQMLDTLQAT